MNLSYGRNFWMLCFSVFFFMSSFNIILPELNSFIRNLDGEGFEGTTFIFFSITALVARPYSGKLSDTIGRRKVILFGMIVGAVVCLFYPLAISLLWYWQLRLIHGLSAGFSPTGATAIATDILPQEKRGTGMGIWGAFISLSFGAAQSFTTPIVDHFGTNGLFFIASIIACIGILLVFSIDETLPVKQQEPFSIKILTSVRWNDVFEPSVIPSAIPMFLAATCSGILLTLSQDLPGFIAEPGEYVNKGDFFLYYSITTILLRIFGGSLSDVIGRRKTLLLGMFLLVVAMVSSGYITNYTHLVISGLLFGCATGVASPTFFAWMADLVPENRRGVGSGTMFIALELGVMVGAATTILFYKNDLQSFMLCCLIGALFALIAMSYLIWHLTKRSSLT